MYNGIRSPRKPGLSDVVLRIDNSIDDLAPQLPDINVYNEVITATALIYSPLIKTVRNDDIAITRTRTRQTLTEDPLSLRLVGAATDIELYSYTYSLVTPTPYVSDVYPPDLDSISWPQDSYYSRNSQMWLWQAVPTPPRLTNIWDARWPVTVLLEASTDPRDVDVELVLNYDFVQAVNVTEVGRAGVNTEQITFIRDEARTAIENPGDLTGVYSLGGLANIREEPSDYINLDTYYDSLNKHLTANYNAVGIPAVPKTIAELLATAVTITGPAEEDDAIIIPNSLIDPPLSPYVFTGTLDEYLGTRAIAITVLTDIIATAPSNGAATRDPQGFLAALLIPGNSLRFTLPAGYMGSLAAGLGGYRSRTFLKWVFWVRPDPTYVPPVSQN